MHLKIPPPVVALICALATWQSERWLPVITRFETLRTDMAIALAVLAVGIDLSALAAFIRSRTTIDPRYPHNTSLIVTNGIYGYTRNPMYLGLAMLLTALSLYLGAAAGLLTVVLFIRYTTVFQIKPEERVLEERFDEDYRAYKARVRRWL